MNEKVKRLERSRCESIDVIWFNKDDSNYLHSAYATDVLENDALQKSHSPQTETCKATSTTLTDLQREIGYFPARAENNLDTSWSDSTDRDSESVSEVIKRNFVATSEDNRVCSTDWNNPHVGSTLGGIIIKLVKSGSKNNSKNSQKFVTGLDTNNGNNSTLESGLKIFDEVTTGKAIFIEDNVVIDSFQSLNHVQDICTLSARVHNQIQDGQHFEGSVIAPLCHCGLLLDSEELISSEFEQMDRGKNQTSIAYERRLAERTSSRITKPEAVKKQVGFKIDPDKKSVLMKRASPKPNEEEVAKKTMTAKEVHVQEHVFHTHNSGLAYSAQTSTVKKSSSGTMGEASRRRLDMRSVSLADHETELRKSQTEVDELKTELAKLSQEIDARNEEIASLKASLQTAEEKDRQMEELDGKLRDTERQMEEESNRRAALQDELARMDERFTALKVEFAEKEEKFETYLMNMYKKGLEAARFEREEELLMLAKNNKSNVTVRELTRKLSRTESELAKWQGLRLGESYFNSDLPRNESDATLSFVRDSFLHFMSDSADVHEHLKALLKIFKYSDEQLGKVWKGLEDFKNIDRKKIMDKIEVANGTAIGKNGHN
ncbi:kinesin heavy chain [Biomphalaria glabrata]|nr:kinesin heavy chain [Biomphalaria glabrata]